MSKKRCPLTLLEVIIGIVLLGVVLTILFGSYRQILKNKSKAVDLKGSIHQTEMCDQRLRYLFEEISVNQEEATFWLQQHLDAQGVALRICFEQKLDRDLDFCGQMQGMCFLDSSQQLSFVTLGKSGQPRLEILLDEVKSIEWSCFDGEKKIWVKEWPQLKGKVPKMVKLTINWKGVQRVWAYFLESPKEPIVYAQKLASSQVQNSRLQLD